MFYVKTKSVPTEDNRRRYICHTGVGSFGVRHEDVPCAVSKSHPIRPANSGVEFVQTAFSRRSEEEIIVVSRNFIQVFFRHYAEISKTIFIYFFPLQSVPTRRRPLSRTTWSTDGLWCIGTSNDGRVHRRNVLTGPSRRQPRSEC